MKISLHSIIKWLICKEAKIGTGWSMCNLWQKAEVPKVSVKITDWDGWSALEECLLPSFNWYHSSLNEEKAKFSW